MRSLRDLIILNSTQAPFLYVLYLPSTQNEDVGGREDDEDEDSPSVLKNFMDLAKSREYQIPTFRRNYIKIYDTRACVNLQEFFPPAISFLIAGGSISISLNKRTEDRRADFSSLSSRLSSRLERRAVQRGRGRRRVLPVRVIWGKKHQVFPLQTSDRSVKSPRRDPRELIAPNPFSFLSEDSPPYSSTGRDPQVDCRTNCRH